MHVHSGPHVTRGLCVGIDMRHPSEDHWYPESMRLFAGLFGVYTALRAKLRMWPELLVARQAARSAAEVHMTVPGRYAERSHCIQLFRRRILRGGVHHAHGLHALRRALIQDGSRMFVVHLALLQPMVALARVVDLFTQFAGGKKRPVAISKGDVHVGVMCQHAPSGSDDPLGAKCISWLRLALE